MITANLQFGMTLGNLSICHYHAIGSRTSLCGAWMHWDNISEPSAARYERMCKSCVRKAQK